MKSPGTCWSRRTFSSTTAAPLVPCCISATHRPRPVDPSLSEAPLPLEHPSESPQLHRMLPLHLQMHSVYKKNYAKIKALVEKRGGHLRGQSGPRCKQAFVHCMMRRMNVLKKSQSHACPICTREILDRKERGRLQARLSSAHTTKQKKEIEEKIRMLDGGCLAIATGCHTSARASLPPGSPSPLLPHVIHPAPRPVQKTLRTPSTISAGGTTSALPRRRSAGP